MKVKSESEVAQSCSTLSDPWTAAHQAPLSMGFYRQEYWSGVPLPFPADPLQWDFPDGPVAKTSHSQCRGPGFDPWSGN